MTEGPGARQSNWRFPLWWLLPLLVLLGFALFGENGVLRLLKSYQQRQALQVEVDQLKRENKVLRREIGSLKNDRRYIESIARKKLGMVREDELVYQFPEKQKDQKSGSGEEEKPAAKP